MKLYSYVITRDFGFAPNPYFDYCTLATCKPQIRKTAKVGDWIAGFGPANTSFKGKLVVLICVNEKLSFDEYWNNTRFAPKKPIFNRSYKYAYGDNIYHHINDAWFQDLSHHSNADGSFNIKNLNRDTAVDHVLIANEFFYFGKNAIDVPAKYSSLIHKGRAHKISEHAIVTEFIEYMSKNYDTGVAGTPFSRENGVFKHYKGE